MGSLVLLHLLLLLILSGDVELNPGDETLLIDTIKQGKIVLFFKKIGPPRRERPTKPPEKTEAEIKIEALQAAVEELEKR